MLTQTEKAKVFRALHEDAGTFIIPNPWDGGTARLLASLGFEALATTSAGCAFSLGQQNNTIPRNAMLEHVAEIASATDLPVSADLEHGYGDGPKAVAETIRLAAAAGAVGGSIEDSTGRQNCPVYEIKHAVERIRAAAEAAHNLPFPFMLTARAENYLVGKPDLDDTIKRLQAYQEAGADILYAPGLPSTIAIATVVSSVNRPLNVLMGLSGGQPDFETLARIGVKRISVGSALSRAALGAFLRAAWEMRVHGSFSFLDEIVSYRDINALFAADAAAAGDKYSLHAQKVGGR